MNRTILAGLAILIVSTSAASAMTTHRSHHSRAVIPNAAAAKMNPSPSARALNANASMAAPAPAMPRGSAKDHEAYMKNLHDSGYDPKNDFTKTGTMRQQ
jgi:hypothetical protein